MRTHEPMAGEHISNAAKKAVQIATAYNEPCQFTFNGVTVVAQPNDDTGKVVTSWQTEMDARAEAYRNSPEGKRAAAEREDADRRNRERAGEVKAFPLHAVLTLATGRVWGNFGDAHEAAEWLFGRSVWTHEFAYNADAIRALALKALPGAADIGPNECPTSPGDCAPKLATMVARFGETVDLPRGDGQS